MSKHHSTVSRRDFMKGLGLAGAGLGAAAAAAPVFHDLDEVMASPTGAQEPRPWWVQERPYLDSTTEIDWASMERYEGAKFDLIASHVTPEHNAQINATQLEKRIRWQTEGTKPGFQVRDYALKPTGWLRPYNAEVGRKIFMGQFDKVQTPEMRGVPKWVGTPEENARMVRTMCRFMGGATVGFGEIIEGKTKKLFHKTTKDWGQNWKIEFEDVDQPYMVGWEDRSDGKAVIPNNHKYVIVVTIRHELLTTRMSPSNISDAVVGKAYDQMNIVAYRLQAFLQGCGYWGLGGGAVYGMTMRPAWGTLTGMGELGRHMELITPEWGPMIRSTLVFPTNLPLPLSNPIDAGISRFCDICTKCADVCPGKAIYTGERDFIITSADATEGNPDNLRPELFNNVACYKRWPLNHFACGIYWRETDTYCGICNAECVFNKYKVQTIHEFVKPIIAKTDLLNGFFFNMDKAFGYGLTPEDQWGDFWDRDYPTDVSGDMNY